MRNNLPPSSRVGARRKPAAAPAPAPAPPHARKPLWRSRRLRPAGFLRPTKSSLRALRWMHRTSPARPGRGQKLRETKSSAVVGVGDGASGQIHASHAIGVHISATMVAPATIRAFDEIGPGLCSVPGRVGRPPGHQRRLRRPLIGDPLDPRRGRPGRAAECASCATSWPTCARATREGSGWNSRCNTGRDALGLEFGVRLTADAELPTLGASP